VWRLSPIWEAVSAPPQSTVAGRPIVSLTLALNYAVGRLDVWSYHAFNLIWHIANALLLFGITRRTLSRADCADNEAAGLAFAIALVRTVHPLLTERVTYVVQRTELLMSSFMLLTLYCVIRNWQNSAPSWLAHWVWAARK
jgi:glycerol uptake facilitator-like aquaporin